MQRSTADEARSLRSSQLEDELKRWQASYAGQVQTSNHEAQVQVDEPEDSNATAPR